MVFPTRILRRDLLLPASALQVIAVIPFLIQQLLMRLVHRHVGLHLIVFGHWHVQVFVPYE
jgi:hypothetical protein